MTHRRAGESLVIVVIIMAFCLVIGATVLGAAAPAAKGVQMQHSERQAYYTAVSALRSVTKSMKTGGLRDYIRKNAAEGTLKESYTSQAVLPQGVEGTADIAVSFSGVSYEQNDNPGPYAPGEDENNPPETFGNAVLKISGINITVTAQAAGQEYRISQRWSYVGKYDKNASKWLNAEDVWSAGSVAQ